MIRSLVSRLLEEATPKSLQNLREAMDHKFECLDCLLNMHGFRDVVERFMKTEKSWLKEKYLVENMQCPLHIQLSQWDNLQTYWDNSFQVEKVEKMASTRRQVCNTSYVKKKDKRGKVVDLVSKL